MDSSTIFSLLEQVTTKLLPEYGTRELARSYAWQLITHLFSCDRARLCARTTIELTAKQHNLLENWIYEIVNNHKPVAYIIGSAPFLDLNLLTRAPILIPRPETEWWTEILITTLRTMPTEQFTLVDLCTGSGCIALSVAQKFPKSTIFGIDISPQAIELAQENAKKNNIKNCRFIVSDLFENMPDDFKADIITANPPYISQKEYANLDCSVKNWEDQRALVSGDDGLDLIKKIIKKSPNYLTQKQSRIARIWLEIGANQAESVAEIELQKPLSRSQVTTDLAGNPRLCRIYCL